MTNSLTKKLDEYIYDPTGFFMIRTPLLSIEKYKDIFVNDNYNADDIRNKLISLFGEKKIKEAIEVSSFSLFKSLNTFKEGNNKKNKKIISSLLKYFIRMASRTTPYGLFSGVSVGKFSDSTEIVIDDNKYACKRIRPDMEWLYGVMRILENDDKILNNLYVISNKLNFINGSRLDISYISNYGKTFSSVSNTNNLSASIRYTSQVKFVIEKAKQKIKYCDLIKLLKYNNPKSSDDKINEFLGQLLINEYIITEIRPPLSNTDQLKYVLLKIKNIDTANKIYCKLLEIQELINEYNNSLLGEGVDLYIKIVEQMKKIYKCKNYLQVDMKLREKSVFLNKNIIDSVTKAVNTLLKLSSNLTEPYYMSEYKQDFMEKYGTDREVSIIELFDEDKGIGSPAGYEMPPSRRTSQGINEDENDIKFSKYIINKILQCLIRNENEVIITDDDVDKISTRNILDYKINELPRTFEINIFIAAKNKEDIDNGKYRIFIGPNFGSNGVGKMFGRFIDILPSTIQNKLKNLNLQEQKLVGEDTLLAEITFLPQNGRTSNVLLSWNAREYEVAVSTNCNNSKKNIDICDLYIGIENDTKKFYIKSKTLNKKVLITSGHMLSYPIGSNIYRFLREISDLKYKNIADRVVPKGLKNFYYIPRIRYDKVIFIPSTWILSSKVLGIDLDKSNKEEFYNAIKKWMGMWKVPQFVYFKQADNRLLLNLNNTLHLNEIFYVLSKNSEITITEIEGSLDDTWVKGSDGNYVAEFSIPFILNKEKLQIANINKIDNIRSNYNNKIENWENQNVLSTYDNRRNFFPGSKWIYVKLYGNSNRIDEFIGIHMLAFCEQLKDTKAIYKYFFIRYGDPDMHIRLRFCGDENTLKDYVLPKLARWFDYLKDEGLLSRVCIDTYSREIERYGGLELIDLAENVFYFDSVIVLKIIKLKRLGELDIDMKVIAVASIINIMEELGVNYELQKIIFMKSYDKDKFREIFQEDRNMYINAANSNNNWESLRNLNDGLLLYDIFNTRKKSLNIYSSRLFELEDKNKLWNSKLDILLSLIHMHCNRLLGSAQENLVMRLTRHTLYALNYYKK